MTVHSIHIFDRKGKTLFTKRYAKGPPENGNEEQLAEQRKLVFGMLFSLREIVASLAPETETRDKGLHCVKTGASTLHNYETASGLRFALYTTNSSNSKDQGTAGPTIRSALRHIYTDIWVDSVIRSPLYHGGDPDIASTTFEQKLDAYLASMPWFR